MNSEPDKERRATFQPTPEEMRAAGYRVVDMIVEHLAALPEKPVTNRATRAEMEERLREPIPETGESFQNVLDKATRDIFGVMTHVRHPRFFAYIPGPANFYSILADALAACYNPFDGAWQVAPGPTQAELVVVDWLRQLCGLPESTSGLFLSGGSMANLTALVVARQAKLRGTTERAIIYCSNQAHSSMNRAAMVAGFANWQIRALPSDNNFRLSIDSLKTAIREDREAGNTPFCVIGTAGTTSSGAIDPLPEIAAFAREEGLWFHVDGAYGAAAILTDEGKKALAGMELADSVTLDPHKWLFQPFECACLLMRNGSQLRDTYRLVPDYLKDSDLAEEEVNFRDYGIQLTRAFRAFKLWVAFKVHGAETFRGAITRGLRLAEYAESVLRRSEHWQIVSPAQLAIACFRYRTGGGEAYDSELNRRLAAALFDTGYAAISTTELNGYTTLRLCTINPDTTEEDIEKTIRLLEKLAIDLENTKHGSESAG